MADIISSTIASDLIIPAVGATFIGSLALLISCFVYCRFESSKPNEWLLLIQDGVLKKAGVGLGCFRGIGAQVVKFSSSMNKVTWQAQEMTNQRAGVEVKGIAIWGVYRPCKEDPDGPFRAFKNIPGLAEGNTDVGNEFVQQLIESIIRSTVANMSIMDVMQRRAVMRDRVRQEVTTQLKGWGIWLETVEIIDCRISSQSLFEDMQNLTDAQLNFANRSEAKLSAETARMATTSKIEEGAIEARRVLDLKRLEEKALMDEKRLQADLRVEKEKNALEGERDSMKLERLEQEQALQLAEVAKRAAIEEARASKEIESRRVLDLQRLEEKTTMDAKRLQADLATALAQQATDSEKKIAASQHALEVEKETNALEGERDAMRLERLESDRLWQLQQVAANAAVEEARATQAMHLKASLEEQELRMMQARLEVEKDLTPMNLQKLQLDAMQNVYANLPLKEVKLINMASGAGLAGLLPGLAEATKQVTGDWDKLSDASR